MEDMIKHEIFPLGVHHELQRQRERLSRYQCRLKSPLDQSVKNSKLEQRFRDNIDDATVNIHFLQIIADLGRFPCHSEPTILEGGGE